MKVGRPFPEVLAEIQRLHESKRDYVAHTTALTLSTDKSGSLLSMEGLPDTEPISTFSLTDHSLRQIQQKLNIPADYFKRLRTDPALHALLDYNVNQLFRLQPEHRLIRTLNGGCRAFLSDRYQVIDNYDIIATVLPEFQELASRHGAVVESCELTDSSMWVKMKLTGIQYNLGRITEGEYRGLDDVLNPMLIISNSETGQRSTKIQPGIFRHVCDNGLVIEEAAMTQYHVGRSLHATKKGQPVEGSGIERLLSDETKEADDRAYLLKIRDVMRAAVSALQFESLVEQFGATKNLRITKPTAAIEVVSKKYALTDGDGERIMQALINGGDLTMFGLVNAVTRAAQDPTIDYDKATDLEEIGGKLMASARDIQREIER